MPAITLIDDPRWRQQDEKKGTVRLDQAAYSLAENDLPGIVPLHLNENLFQAAQDATSQSDIADLMQAALNQLHSYPKSGAKQLQKAVAAHLSIASHKLVIGHGSSAVLRDLFLYLLRKGDTLLMPAPGWSYYQALANLVEARIDTFALAEKGHSFAYDAFSIANKIGATQPKAVLICSPNNPTGSVMPVEDFIWLAQVYPQVNFILDEAYYGFADVYSAEQERLLLAATELANVFLVRTFSKFYGWANLRVGFAVCNEVNGRNLNKIALAGRPELPVGPAAHRVAGVPRHDRRNRTPRRAAHGPTPATHARVALGAGGGGAAGVTWGLVCDGRGSRCGGRRHSVPMMKYST
jgi:histidinol-phosphate/aromatic aminotransferase/cobyric acid decarboxylase-like protein